MSVYRRKDSPYYWTNFILLGKLYQFSTKTKRKYDALKVEEITKRDIIDGKYFKRPETVPLKVLMETYIENHMRSKAAYETYKRCARNIMMEGSPLAHLNAHEVERHHIEAYRNWRLNKKVKPATINREMSVLRASYNYQKVKFPLNPVSLVKFFTEEEYQRRRYLFPDEKKALLENSHYPLKEIIYLDLKTGLRLSELLRLEWNHIDFNSNRLWVMKSKSGRQRAVPILAGVGDMLRGMPKKGKFVFSHEDGKSYRKSEVRQMWETVRKVVKQMFPDREDFVFHDIRRTFGSELAQRGVSEKMIATLLGHSSIYVTQRYAHLSPSTLDTAMLKLEEKEDDDSYRSRYVSSTISVGKEEDENTFPLNPQQGQSQEILHTQDVSEEKINARDRT